MSNSYNLAVDTTVITDAIAAHKVATDETGVIVANIHDTELPLIKTDTGNIRTATTAMYVTDLPAVKNEVDDIRAVDVAVLSSKITTVDTQVDAIRVTDVPTLDLLIDTVKTDTADIRTDVTALKDTDIPAVKADTADIRTDTTAIKDTDLPAVKSDTDANKTQINYIRTNDLPEVKTVVDANKVLIDANLDAPITDIVNPISGYALSDDLIHSNDPEVSHDTTTYTKKVEILCPVTGTIRIKFDLRTHQTGQTAYGKIYKGGVEHGTEQTETADTFVTKSEDLAFEAGDKIQLYLKATTGYIAYAQNIRIYGILINEFVNITV